MRRLSLIAALALLPAIAAAQDAPAAAPALNGAFAADFRPGGVFALPPDERFAAIDKNKDGKIAKDEYAAVLNKDARPYIESIWNSRDLDKDGWMSKEELVSNGPERRRPGGPPAAQAAARPAAAAE